VHYGLDAREGVREFIAIVTCMTLIMIGHSHLCNACLAAMPWTGLADERFAGVV